MKKLSLWAVAMSLLVVLMSCAQPVSSEVLQSEKPRITSPTVTDTDLSSLIDGNSAFAFDLYQILREKDGNLFLSPHSISLALAMTYAGARGETEQQMAEAMHFILSQNSLHSAFNSLDLELGKRGEGAEGKDEEGFRLNIVNAIWGQQDYEFLAEFLDALAQNYGAGLRALDFIGAPDDSRITINEWVSDQTEGRIEDLIPQGAISPMTRLVLTNAIYFNAAWQYQFEENATQDGPFHLLDGTQLTVPMMRQGETFGYAEGSGFQAVELPYDGGELSMVVLLPDAGQFASFENSLDSMQVNDIIRILEYRPVNLTMPKFEFESSFGLVEALSAMGMPVAFTESADFSGMTGSRDLFISDVIHEAFVSVDEAGTEAAAATAVIMKATSAPASPVEVTVDRPFLFLIRDIETGAILFIGRTLDPGS